MKKIVVVIAFLLASTFSFGQSAFDKFEDKEGVASVVVNKKMFEMMKDTVGTHNTMINSNNTSNTTNNNK